MSVCEEFIRHPTKNGGNYGCRNHKDNAGGSFGLNAPRDSFDRVGGDDHVQGQSQVVRGGSSQSGAATGTLEATYDTASKQLSYTANYSGLTGNATMAHFHGPADAGKNAPVVIPVQGSVASPIKGTASTD